MKIVYMVKEYKLAYRALISFTVIVLCLVVPGFLLAPYLFHNVALSILTNMAKIGSFISFTLGVWLIIVAFHLRYKEQQKAVDIGKDGVGGEPIVLFIPYILYKGTKSIITSMQSKNDN